MQPRFQKFDLSGKLALITGAAGLLGQEHAMALLESGAGVYLTDVSAEALERTTAALKSHGFAEGIVALVMDVTSAESVKAVADNIRRTGARVDILVNNAAIDPKVKESGLVEESRLENFSLEQWNLQVAVGLTGAFLCAQTFGSAMAADGNGGVILNIASDLSVFSPDQRLYRRDGVPEAMQPVKPVTYSVIKSGLIGLTRYLATYWPHLGVRCNAISPGGVFNGQNAEFVTRLSQLVPLGRMARRDEYRAAIQFLCSEASSYMNGQNIVMDGGRSAW